MTIYILDQSTQKCAEFLDDKSLDQQIKDIGQLLCNVIHEGLNSTGFNRCKDSDKHPTSHCEIPLRLKYTGNMAAFAEWVEISEDNFIFLYNLGIACCKEYNYRYHGGHPISDTLNHKYKKILEFCKNFLLVPDKRINQLELTPIPTAMPEKYILPFDGDPLKSRTVFDYHVKIKGNIACCDVIKSYRNYYNNKLSNRSAWTVWTVSKLPEWALI